MMEEAISASRVTFKYRTQDIETTAVRDATFSIAKGDYVTIQGPSGCGKSSLLSMLALAETPASGRLVLFGQDLGQASERTRARFRASEIGMVFQSFHLIPELTVLENLLLKLKYATGGRSKSAREVALATLRRLGLEHRQNHYPDQLSGGQQQRTALGRALVASPRILLADEPTGNLDSRSSESVMDLFDEIHESGVTIVMVTHNPEHAMRARRRFNMLDGMITEDHSNV